MDDDKFLTILERLEKNLQQIKTSLAKEGLTEIALATTVVFKDKGAHFLSGTARLGNPHAIKGSMQSYIIEGDD